MACQRVLNLLQAMCTSAAAFSAENSTENCVETFSGLLQGSPPSGSLFVLAINPLLIALQGVPPNNQQVVVTACADDIGIVLQELCSASRVAELFAVLEKQPALQLKAAKCVIVPQRLMTLRVSKVPRPLCSQRSVRHGTTLL